ncbi:MAG: DUF4349 domain-containing protein [Alkaliphilus sp.]
MKKILLLILVLVFTFNIIGCASDREGDTPRPESNQSSDIAGMQTNELNIESIEMQKKLIKNLSASIEVQDIEKAISEITNMVTPLNGYIHNQRLWSNEKNTWADVNIKVPSIHFAQISSELKNIGKVTNTNISSTDVTEEFIDLVARRKTFETQEVRLLSFTDKAENVDELLSIERELERVRFEIERIIGRINYLENAIDYSNININLTSKLQPTTAKINGSWERIVFAFKDGLGVFGRVVIGFVTVLVWSLPFIIVILICLAIFFKYRKAIRKNLK